MVKALHLFARCTNHSRVAVGMNQCSPNDCSCPTSSDPTSVCPCFSVTNGQYHCEAAASGAVLLQGPGYNSAGSCTGQTTAPACKKSGWLCILLATCAQLRSLRNQIPSVTHECVARHQGVFVTHGNIHQPLLICLPATLTVIRQACCYFAMHKLCRKPEL